MKRIIFFYVFIVCAFRLFATDHVVVTEVMYDTPLNEDTNRHIHNYGEYIELYNTSNNIVDLSGWSVETLSPHQVFTIPVGITVHPKSTLIIAFGEENTMSYSVGDMTIEELTNGMTDFHWLYGLTDFTNGPQILYQTLFILPNQHTTLLLKNSSRMTQDSVIYENPYPGSLDNARNEDMDDKDVYRGCLSSMYSLQRMHVTLVDDMISYRSSDWLGKFMNSQSSIDASNTLGYIPNYFYDDDNYNDKPVSSSLSNYIQEITPRIAQSHIDTAIQVSSDSTQPIVKRTYYDAMCRPTLTYLYDYTPNHHHLVSLNEYDSYARPTKEWLPIVTEIDCLTNTTFKNNATSFYNNDSRPFLERIYSTETWDNGIIRNELAGTQKAGDDMNSHKTAFAIRGNNANEVKLFSVSSDGLLECNGFYQEGMLRIKQTKDEDNITKVVYTNLRDQVVMEKVDNATTYYVYNDLHQLCYVLPPIAANQISNGVYNDTIDILKKYAYVYKYDDRGNQIYKRLPGCKPILMVYDKSNSLVLTQTGNQLAYGTYWTAYKYDSLRRLIYTAEVIMPISSHEELIEDYSNKLIVESFSGESQTGYSHNFFTHVKQILTVNYYDDYHHLPLISSNKRRNMIFAAFNGNATCANATGLLTGTRTYYLDGSGNYSETVYYYDYRGREIQRRTTNHLGGYDVLSTKYDFANNVTDTWSSQSTNNGITTTEYYHYTYDHANRPLTTTYTFNDDPPIVLQSYHYDEIGRVRSRHIHNGIDSVAFNYDIRNQITQIKSSGYNQTYYYNQPCPIYNGNVEGLYNGNINATTWTYDNTLNGYIYRYDQMNRLMNTYSIHDGVWAFRQNTESFNYDEHGNITRLIRWNSSNTIDDISFTYNGNQLDKIDEEYESNSYLIKQYHDNNSSTDDDFAYDANGNMIHDKDRGIAAIRYNLLNLPDTIQFADGNQIVHRYDAAGNRLSTDYYTRKLNIPVPLGRVFSAADSINKYHLTREAFLDNCVYTANNRDFFGIEFVHNPEGYIRYNNMNEHYHFYYIKDLLGNIRETYKIPNAGTKECVQRMQYYPSGLPWAASAGASEQPWKYNGKEFVEMHGLDEYDSKARWYYPAICRTTTMDPLAEKYYSTSPYAWCGNNPVIFTDANGCWFDFSGMTDEEKTVFDSNIDFLKENMMFQRLYSELEESPEKYSILYGETTYLDEHNVDGQFVPSKNGGGTITFLSGKQIDGSVAAEEFFHAYQHHNRNFYANGEFNREFEAKTFVTILGINAGWGYIGYSGMTDFQSNIMQGIYLTKGYNTIFENDYMIHANQYAEHNKRANYGNSNYQTSNSVLPFSLKKLLNFLNFE